VITSSVTPQQPGGLDAAGAVLQPLLGDHPAAKQRLLEDLDGPRALLGLVADGIEGRGRQSSPQDVSVDDVFQAGRAKATGHVVYMGTS
jgi:hypothetical protein